LNLCCFSWFHHILFYILVRYCLIVPLIYHSLAYVTPVRCMYCVSFHFMLFLITLKVISCCCMMLCKIKIHVIHVIERVSCDSRSCCVFCSIYPHWVCFPLYALLWRFRFILWRFPQWGCGEVLVFEPQHMIRRIDCPWIGRKWLMWHLECTIIWRSWLARHLRCTIICNEMIGTTPKCTHIHFCW